ncbi:hypothetical protein [Cryobacterium sp. Y62]|uniref:ATP dependent DNA ligase n=1 Tax=Cryobacterium sp. Y62 TaxID=2048284 RepID=UPI000CE2B73B|nr:hypothetical protein [Cryobacterium sp. Y62]
MVGGWRPGKGIRSGTIGSLLLGVPTDTGLRYVGRVGTGFAAISHLYLGYHLATDALASLSISLVLLGGRSPRTLVRPPADYNRARRARTKQ